MNDHNIDSTYVLACEQAALIHLNLDSSFAVTRWPLCCSALAIVVAACNFPRPANIDPDAAPTSDASSPSDGNDAGTPPLDSRAAAPRIVASNTVSRADLAAGIEALLIPAGKTYVIDTDQGSMFDATNSNAPLRAAGEGLKNGVFYRTDDHNRAFFAITRIMLGENAILRGVGGRALILISDGPIEIHGIIDVSAGHCSPSSDSVACAGPGGGRGGDTSAARGCGPGQVGRAITGSSSGSGGGGYASPGGAGGPSVPPPVGGGGGDPMAGGAGGTGATCPGPSLDPIQGGSGGAVAATFSGVHPGGGGGGAVQLTSYTSLSIVSPTTPSTSGVWAGGAGGSGGAPGGTSPISGGGGGSGGAILLEAPAIDIRSGTVLAANGGGGGTGAAANDGQPGRFGIAPALGGEAATGGGGAGGVGATRDFQASDGSLGVIGTMSSAGGGGGGAGRIRINAVMLTNLSAEAVSSPAPSVNVPAATE